MTRHTPTELRKMAESMASGTYVVSKAAGMLRQAADDAEDAERYREALEWIIKRPSSAAEDIARNAIAGGTYPPRKETP